MDVAVTVLPGIGVRKDFEVASGRRVGVVSHRDGSIDLIVSELDDLDACAVQVSLRNDEATALANLLGALQFLPTVGVDQSDLSGITTRHLPLGNQSPYIERTLGESEMRTRTKVSIVAVLRAGQLHAAPGPDFTFAAADLLVVVGTPAGLDAAAKLLAHG